MIAIVDYGSGNIQAIKNIYDNLKVESFFASEPSQLERANKIVLPGVGAFDEAVSKLKSSGMLDVLNHMVLDNKVPVLGVCVGMQVMANASEEGDIAGLGWFDANVKKFDATTIPNKPKLPHMGWNEVLQKKDCQILDDIQLEKGYYFLHSYYFECNNSDDVLLTAHYGNEFTCAVQKQNIFGFQFHPEKSHSNGINLFRNFSRLS